LAVDENKRVLIVNKVARKIFEAKPEEINGLPIKEFCDIYDARALLKFFSADEDPVEDVIFLNGRELHVSSLPVFFDYGKDIFAHGERFPHKVKTLGKVIFLRDKGKLNPDKRAKNDFMLSAMHQLKTAAALAKWSFKMFLSGDFGRLTKEQKSVLTKLNQKNEETISLTEGLSNAIKAESGFDRFNRESVDLKEVVEEVLADFKNKIKAKKIKLKFKKLSGTSLKVFADKGKIKLAVENLVDNALKYTNDKGSVLLSLEDNGKYLKFEIKDSGIGVPKNQQPKIFNEFFRAQNAVKKDTIGTGVGLFLAKKNIEGHGGKIWFESEEGQGSTFSFTLPKERVK